MPVEPALGPEPVVPVPLTLPSRVQRCAERFERGTGTPTTLARHEATNEAGSKARGCCCSTAQKARGSLEPPAAALADLAAHEREADALVVRPGSRCSRCEAGRTRRPSSTEIERRRHLECAQELGREAAPVRHELGGRAAAVAVPDRQRPGRSAPASAAAWAFWALEAASACH